MVEYINDNHKELDNNLGSLIDETQTYLNTLKELKYKSEEADSISQCSGVRDVLVQTKTVYDTAVMTYDREFEVIFEPMLGSATMDSVDPKGMLNSIADAVAGDNSEVEKRLNQFIDIVTSDNPANSLKDIAMKELIDSGWSLSVDVGPDGKKATLVRGSDVVNFLNAALDGDTLTEGQILLGVVTKFEKEAFGFSIVELAQDIDKFARAFAAGTPILDLLQGDIMDKLELIVEKLGGNSEYIKKIKAIAKLAKQILNAYNKMKAMRKKAIEDFNKLKEMLVEVEFIDTEEATTTEEPVEEGEGETTLEPTTTFVIQQPADNSDRSYPPIIEIEHFDPDEVPREIREQFETIEIIEDEDY